VERNVEEQGKESSTTPTGEREKIRVRDLKTRTTLRGRLSLHNDWWGVSPSDEKIIGRQTTNNTWKSRTFRSIVRRGLEKNSRTTDGKNLTIPVSRPVPAEEWKKDTHKPRAHFNQH